MKKIIKWLLIICLTGTIALVASSALMSTTKQSENNDIAQLFDRFNPMVSKESVFVLTSNEFGTKQEPGGYMYYQDAYKEDGTSYKISFYSAGELREGAYLELDAKGRFVKGWEEVGEDQLPEKVKETLRS